MVLDAVGRVLDIVHHQKGFQQFTLGTADVDGAERLCVNAVVALGEHNATARERGEKIKVGTQNVSRDEVVDDRLGLLAKILIHRVIAHDSDIAKDSDKGSYVRQNSSHRQTAERIGMDDGYVRFRIHRYKDREICEKEKLSIMIVDGRWVILYLCTRETI